MSITGQAQKRAVTICYPQANPPKPNEIATWIAEEYLKKVDFNSNQKKKKVKKKLEDSIEKDYKKSGKPPGYTVSRRIGEQVCIVTVTMCYEMGAVTDEDGVDSRRQESGSGAASEPPDNGGTAAEKRKTKEEHRKDMHRHEIGHQVHQYKSFRVLRCLKSDLFDKNKTKFDKELKKVGKKIKKNYHDKVGGKTQAPARDKKEFTDKAIEAAKEELKKKYDQDKVKKCCENIEQASAGTSN